MHKTSKSSRSAVLLAKRTLLSAITVLSLAKAPSDAQSLENPLPPQTETPVDTHTLVAFLADVKNDGAKCLAAFDANKRSASKPPGGYEFSTAGNVFCMRVGPYDTKFLNAASCYFMPAKFANNLFRYERAATMEVFERMVKVEGRPFDIQMTSPLTKSNSFFVLQFDQSNREATQEERILVAIDPSGNARPSHALSPVIPDVTKSLDTFRQICWGASLM